jgi:hypothetical protein
MLIPLFTLFLAVSIAWLAIGLKGRNQRALLALNVFWWIGAFVSAYFVWLTWQERAYSENWAAIGFLFCSVPYILMTGVMASVELFCIRKWHDTKTRPIKWVAAGLIVFLLSQMITGILSA